MKVFFSNYLFLLEKASLQNYWDFLSDKSKFGFKTGKYLLYFFQKFFQKYRIIFLPKLIIFTKNVSTVRFLRNFKKIVYFTKKSIFLNNIQ